MKFLFLFLFLVAGGRRFSVVLSVVCAADFLLTAVAEVGLTQKKFDKNSNACHCWSVF